MAKQRIINTRFWSDTYVVNLDPLEKYLFLYFLTNEHTNICGIYELSTKTMANETGLEEKTVQKMIKRLKGKVYYVNGWVYIRNFSKHQRENESIKIGVSRAMSLVPPEVLLKINEIDKLPQSDTSLGTEPDIPELESEPKLKPEPKGYAAKAASSSSPKKLDPKKDTTPQDLKEYLEKMRASPSRHIRLIAEYADELKPRFTTKGQWHVFTQRHLRDASDLAPFTDEQIANAFSQVKKNLKTSNNPKGYITKWTIKTLLDFIHEN
jgi:hypothetical protein